MARRTSSRLPRVALPALCLAGIFLCATSPAWADRLILQDGRELEGTLVPLESIVGNKAPPMDGVAANNILMCDTGLKRIFVSQRNIREIIPGAKEAPNEVFKLKQKSGVARGQVNDVQAIMQITPFDEFGRRTFTINTPNGPTDIFQGITEINPVYTRVAGINYQWDLRVATSSIPLPTLEIILGKVLDPQKEEHRRKYAMFLIQCQRYGEAKAALDQMIKDFPGLKDRVEPVSRQLTQARARQILKELEVRKAAGQFRLGRSILEQFPVDGVSGEILQTVRTMNDEVRTEDDQATKAWKDFDRLLAKCNDDDRKRIMTVRNEIFARRSELVPSDVLDWIGFCSLLAQEWQEAAGAPKEQPVQTPAVRLGAMFPVEARDIVQNVAKTGGGTEAEAWRLTSALNAVLQAPNFYQEDEFGSVALPEEAKLLLARTEKLRVDDQMRLNRMLLEAAFPQLIMVSEFSGLTPTTIQRLSSFMQLAGDPKLEPAEKLSLAVSGWLMGSNAAQQNLAIALSLWDARGIVREYLNQHNGPDRERLIAELRALEGTTPENVVKLIENMAPPIPTQPQEHPGFFELSLPPATGELPVTYFVQLPHEYDPHRRYPTIVTLHGARSVAGHSVGASRSTAAADAENPNRTDGKKDNGKAAPPDVRASQIDFWAGSPDQFGQRQGQSMRNGYIVIAPAWGAQGQPEYEYSAREHNAVLASLRDACRRFAIDTDRVFLTGHDIGGDAAYDIGFAHPDLWAGVLPIVGKSDRYCSKTWPNALRLPVYSLGGELDPTRVLANAREHDRLFLRNGTDLTVVEYLGRGHEYFSEDLLDMFDWMKRKKRDFFPKKVEGVSMRPWDNFFFWIETSNHPAKTICLPNAWPTDGAKTNAMAVEAEVKGDSRILVKSGAGTTTVLLSPEMGLDFTKNIEVQIGSKRMTRVGTPDLVVILEDARTRGDRQHVFWSKVTSQNKVVGAAEVQAPRARPAKRP